MDKNYDFDLLKDEKVEIYLRPHPLSFLKYYFANAYLVLLAVALFLIYLRIHEFIRLSDFFANLLNAIFSFIPSVDSESLFFLVIFWLILLLSGLLIGVLWVSKAPVIYLILVALAGTLIEFYSPIPQYLTFMPKATIKVWLLVISAAIGLVLTEIYRRGHRYFLTNYRIVMVKGFIGKETREIMYSKISDVYMEQGLLGRIFNYGTIIPISEAGFGLGEDASLASISAAHSKRSGVSIGFGGKRGVSRPRAATYFSLYGVPNPRRVRAVIVNRQVETGESQILRRIEDMLREDRDKKGMEDSTDKGLG